MHPRRFVSITGVESFIQAETIDAIFDHFRQEHFGECLDAQMRSGYSPHAYLKLGILVSNETLSGREDRAGRRYPRLDKLEPILSLQTKSPYWGAVHYSTDDPGMLTEDLAEIAKIAGRSLREIQINRSWPDPSDLNRARVAIPDNVEVSLQIGKSALDSVGWNALDLLAKLLPYQPLIDGVTIDPSQTGSTRYLNHDDSPIDLNDLAPIVSTIAHHFPRLRITISGNLWAESVWQVSSLIKECPYLGVEAGHKLRDPERDTLELGDRVMPFLKRAIATLHPIPAPEPLAAA